MKLSKNLTHKILFLVILLLGASFAVFGEDISGPSETSGSVLVYPFYTSNTATGSDTRITIANTTPYRALGIISALPVDTLRTAYVHLLFYDGSSCQQADVFLCLTPWAALSFNASEYDPGVTGMIVAVAVDLNGNLTRQNSLIGDAFVADGKYVGNYGAEGFKAYGNPGIGNDGIIWFGVRPASLPLINCYDWAPNRFSTTIQSVVDAPGQKIVTAGLDGVTVPGSISGAAQTGIGYIYNYRESPFGSFSGFHNGTCQAISILTPTAPRVPRGMNVLIPSSQVGTITIPTGPAVGLLMTPQGNNKWSGIRGLHKNSVIQAALPTAVFAVTCS